MDFWTIEVVDGPTSSARSWREAHGESLAEAAVTHGAQEWTWVVRDWGVLLEVAFRDESGWLRFRSIVAVQAALDAVPDPVNGILIYSGRGGSSGATLPRRPRPVPLVGGAALPEPEPELPGRTPGLQQGRFQRPNDTSSIPVTVPAL